MCLQGSGPLFPHLPTPELTEVAAYEARLRAKLNPWLSRNQRPYGEYTLRKVRRDARTWLWLVSKRASGLSTKHEGQS